MQKTHEISYAYPTPIDACRMGHKSDGCYMLTHNDGEHAHATLAEAMAHAATLGTEPTRYSMEHPYHLQTRGPL